MLSKLYGLVAIVGVAAMLAGSGFAGYLLYADKLTSERVKLLASVLRGELDDALDDEPGDADDAQAGRQENHQAQSATEIEAAGKREQTRSANLDRAAQDVAARQALLDQTLAHLVKLQERFQAEKVDWVKKKETLAADARDRGFKRELAYVEKLSPKQAKEHIVRTWTKSKADVVRLFMAMKTNKGEGIMAQLKSPTELDILHELLEQLRLQDVDNLAAESRRNPGDG